MRLLVAAALVVTLYAAETRLTVEQLYSFIKSSVRLKHPDRQVASFLQNVKMAERLDDRTIEDLQGYGAGPRTLAALRTLRDASSSLPVARRVEQVAPASIPPPSPDEQDRVLHEVRQNARNYTKNLPDFLCTQVTRRYVDPSGLEFWQRMDVLTARLSFFEQREDYKLVLVNSRVADQEYQDVGGATSTGEFGSLLRELFSEKARARMRWERWATLRGKRTHVFSYRVAQPNSDWHITYERRDSIVPGYRGLVYVDNDTNMVLRVTLEAEDIPPSFPIQQASTVLDYDFTEISGQQHLLPLRAVIRMRQGKLLTKNEVEFRLYRRFTADATITFTPDPLPEDQTDEQPPQ
jgi:hypothetical protein